MATGHDLSSDLSRVSSVITYILEGMLSTLRFRTEKIYSKKRTRHKNLCKIIRVLIQYDWGSVLVLLRKVEPVYYIQVFTEASWGLKLSLCFIIVSSLILEAMRKCLYFASRKWSPNSSPVASLRSDAMFRVPLHRFYVQRRVILLNNIV